MGKIGLIRMTSEEGKKTAEVFVEVVGKMLDALKKSAYLGAVIDTITTLVVERYEMKYPDFDKEFSLKCVRLAGVLADVIRKNEKEVSSLEIHSFQNMISLIGMAPDESFQKIYIFIAGKLSGILHQIAGDLE